MVVFPDTSNVGDSRCAQFQIIGDEFKEADETFTINDVAENQFDSISGQSMFQVTILDDGDGKLPHIIGHIHTFTDNTTFAITLLYFQGL